MNEYVIEYRAHDWNHLAEFSDAFENILYDLCNTDNIKTPWYIPRKSHFEHHIFHNRPRIETRQNYNYLLLNKHIILHYKYRNQDIKLLEYKSDFSKCYMWTGQGKSENHLGIFTIQVDRTFSPAQLEEIKEVVECNGSAQMVLDNRQRNLTNTKIAHGQSFCNIDTIRYSNGLDRVYNENQSRIKELTKKLR